MQDYISGHTVKIDHDGFAAAVSKLRDLVEANLREAEIQAHLESHPYILSEQYAHCHHVFPRVRLGDRYEADFFCLECPSYGNKWIAIEIERPDIKVVTRTGRKTSELEHALQQLRDWRKWISDNIDYARRPRNRNGLGLEDIEPRFQCSAIIGRRSSVSEEFDSIRRQVLSDECIEIRSWDSVIERAEQRAKLLQEWHSQFVRSSEGAP